MGNAFQSFPIALRAFLSDEWFSRWLITVLQVLVRARWETVRPIPVVFRALMKSSWLSSHSSIYPTHSQWTYYCHTRLGKHTIIDDPSSATHSLLTIFPSFTIPRHVLICFFPIRLLQARRSEQRSYTTCYTVTAWRMIRFYNTLLRLPIGRYP